MLSTGKFHLGGIVMKHEWRVWMTVGVMKANEVFLSSEDEGAMEKLFDMLRCGTWPEKIRMWCSSKKEDEVLGD